MSGDDTGEWIKGKPPTAGSAARASASRTKLQDLQIDEIIAATKRFQNAAGGMGWNQHVVAAQIEAFGRMQAR